MNNQILAKNKKDKIQRKISLSRFILFFLLLIVLIFLLMTLGVYYNQRNYWSIRISNVIPYPCAVVEYFHPISFKEKRSDLNSVKRFYESQDFSKIGLRVDFSTETGKKKLKIKEKQILDKLVEDKSIEVLAKRYGIRISNSEVDQNLKRKLQEYGSGESVKNKLQKLYGWNLEDFKKKIVAPSLYKEALEKKVFNSPELKKYNQKAKQKIVLAKKELQRGQAFDKVTEEYSSDYVAKRKGEMGWYKLNQIIPAVSKEVSQLPLNQTSDIIESELGFHIILIEEKKVEREEKLYKIKQIFVPKLTFSDWLNNKMKQMHYWIWDKDFYWDKKTNEIEFRDPNLKKFEEKIKQENLNDPSLVL